MATLRLLLFVLLYVGLGVGAIALLVAGGRRLLKEPLERRRRRRLGAQNAKRLAVREEETCFVCLCPINPARDPYDARHGWYHSTCFNQLLDGGGPS